MGEDPSTSPRSANDGKKNLFSPRSRSRLGKTRGGTSRETSPDCRGVTVAHCSKRGEVRTRLQIPFCSGEKEKGKAFQKDRQFVLSREAEARERRNFSFSAKEGEGLGELRGKG